MRDCVGADAGGDAICKHNIVNIFGIFFTFTLMQV